MLPEIVRKSFSQGFPDEVAQNRTVIESRNWRSPNPSETSKASIRALKVRPLQERRICPYRCLSPQARSLRSTQRSHRYCLLGIALWFCSSGSF
jgi:hypothetical protein